MSVPQQADNTPNTRHFAQSLHVYLDCMSAAYLPAHRHVLSIFARWSVPTSQALATPFFALQGKSLAVGWRRDLHTQIVIMRPQYRKNPRSRFPSATVWSSYQRIEQFFTAVLPSILEGRDEGRYAAPISPISLSKLTEVIQVVVIDSSSAAAASMASAWACKLGACSVGIRTKVWGNVSVEGSDSSLTISPADVVSLPVNGSC